MQHHRHSRTVVQGLNYIQEAMLAAVGRIAAECPPADQKHAVETMVRHWLEQFSHIWFQSTMGDGLYSKDPQTARIYEEDAGVLAAKLKAVTQGVAPEEFAASFAYEDSLTPAQALARAMQPEQKAQYALAAPDAPCWCGHASHLGGCALCGCNAVYSTHLDARERVEVR